MMTQRTRLRISMSAFLIVLLLQAAGCGSTGYRKGNAAAASLRDAALAIQNENEALDATVASLNDLVHQPSNLKRQFNAFGRSLDRLTASAQRADRTIEDMRQTSAAYFDNWQNELAAIEYEIIRAQSEARKQEVSAQVTTILRRFQETQEVVHPMITYLEDLRSALSTDLTAGGLEAVKDIARRAEENARKVRIGLEQLASELNESGARLSTGAPNSQSQFPAARLDGERRAAALDSR